VFTYPSIFGVGQSNGVIGIYPLSIPVAIATIQKLQNWTLQPMEISKRYNLVPVKDNCALFAPTLLFLDLGYLTVSFKFLPWRLLLSWRPTIFIQRQNWLQAHKSVKRWNAAARLYSMAMGQIPRSTERISNFVVKYV